MTGTLVLVRHAAVSVAYTGRWVGGGTDAPADGAALARCAALREVAHRHPPRLTLSSPLLRAWQTARAAALWPCVDPRLRERHFGVWEGRPVAECLQGLDPRWTRDTASWLRMPVPGAETLDHVAARVDEFLRRLDAGPGGCVWCVAHAGPLAVLRARVCDIGAAAAFDDGPAHGGWLVLHVGRGEVIERGCV